MRRRLAQKMGGMPDPGKGAPAPVPAPVSGGGSSSTTAVAVPGAAAGRQQEHPWFPFDLATTEKRCKVQCFNAASLTTSER